MKRAIRRSPILLALGALLALVLTACSIQPTQPGPAVSRAAQPPAAVPAPTPPAAPLAPTAVPAPTPTAARAAPVAAATPTARPASAGPTTAEALRFELVPGRCEARYRVREQLAGRSLPNDAVGVTKGVTGQIVLLPTGEVVREQSRVVVDLRTLQSDSGRRDAFVGQNTLETGAYLTAELVPTALGGLPPPLPTAGEVRFQLLGDLTVRGKARPTTWEVTAQVAEGTIRGTATTSVTFADLGLAQPRVASVLSVADTIRLEIDFQVQRAPAGGSRPG